MAKSYYTYILTNSTKSVLYTGITNDLQQRIVEHYLSRGNPQTFTGRYNVFYLLYFEEYDKPMDAIDREKEIKGWRREKKIDLIKTENPNLVFLNDTIFDTWPPLEMYHRGSES
jgi:putative endonuclease